MADSGSGERTEEPTAKKTSDAREKGQIARSKELGTMFVLVGMAVALMIVGGDLVESLSSIMKRLFSLSRAEVMDIHALYNVAMSSLSLLVAPMLWIFLIVFILALVGNSLLGGFNLSMQAITPKPSKLSPLAGFKRMFGAQAAIELLKSLLKFFVVATVAYLLLNGLFDDIIGLSEEAVPINYVHAVNLLLGMFTTLALSLIIIAVIDAPYQLWNHTRQLKMTKQEVKDESKNSEGNPEIKSRIRRTQMEMSQKRMMAEVPNADVVITNPTHFSVAIKYDPAGSRAPVVLAKGVDEMAMHIRKIAKEHQVEMVASPMLARSLYYTTEIDEEIPEQLFAAVAQVLAFVFQLSQYKKGKGKRPVPLAKTLPVPDDFRY
jgi:flagellar biosynthetic protein FlhB